MASGTPDRLKREAAERKRRHRMRAKEQEKGRQSDDWFQEKPANWPLLQSCLDQGKQEDRRGLWWYCWWLWLRIKIQSHPCISLMSSSWRPIIMETNHYIVTDQISSIGGTFLDPSWNCHKSSLCDMLVYNHNNQVFNNFGCWGCATKLLLPLYCPWWQIRT